MRLVPSGEHPGDLSERAPASSAWRRNRRARHRRWLRAWGAGFRAGQGSLPLSAPPGLAVVAEGLPELIACEDEANISDLESNCELFAAEHENPNAPDSALAETAYEVDGRSGLTACEYEANISDLGSNYNFVAAEHKHPSVLEKPLAETNYEADGLSGLIAREHEANISELGSNCQFLAAEHELSNAPVRQLAEASYGVELPGLVEKPFAGPGGNPSSSGCNESAVNPYDALYEALWTRERMSVAEAMAFTGLNEHGLEGGTLVGLWSYSKGDTWVQRA